MARSFRDAAPFPDAAPVFLADPQLRANLRGATTTIRAKRDRLVDELSDFEAMRRRAEAIKNDALGRLGDLLVELEQNVQAAGGTVHFARDAAEAREIIVNLVAAEGVDEVVKVKSMTTAEIELNGALEAAGITPVETDLAELIVQLGDDLPSHIVVPAIHRNRREIRDLFAARMGERGLAAPDGIADAPAELAAAARAHLRDRFLRAKVAISGANFMVAESGTLAIVESEGNGRMCLTLPETLISLVGIEKVLPTNADLGVFLRLLARSATGERMNPYTSLFRGVHQGDGPRTFHLVLLDNGRTATLADPVGRQALRCIRCAACLNVCPVYERVGGHAYGSVYPGPIGAVLAPQLDHVVSDPVSAALPFASTLCGACFAVCPVRIDIPRLLVHLRARVVEHQQVGGPKLEALTMGAAAVVLASPRKMALAERLFGVLPDGLLRRLAPQLPGALGAWAASRDLPAAPPESFRSWWARTRGREPASPPRPTPLLGSLAARRFRRGATAASPAVPAERHGDTRAKILADLAPLRRPNSTPPPNPARPPEPAPSTLTTFLERVGAYHAEVTTARADAVDHAVAAALARSGARRVLVPPGIQATWLPSATGAPFETDTGEPAATLEHYDAAISACAVAIAESGTVVLDGGSGQGRRALSLLPDHLIVVVRDDQVVDDADQALARLVPGTPQTWISGPSATSDIELQRVEGVHGPRRLDVIVIA